MDGIIDGPPPEPPSSPEQNIARGTKAIARVLAAGRADMAAMHRKDLGWIAFEPGDVFFTTTGQIRGAGLRKIQAKHAEDLAMLPAVLERGKISYVDHASGRRSVLLDSGDYRAVLRLDHDDKRQTWVLTHFQNSR